MKKLAVLIFIVGNLVIMASWTNNEPDSSAGTEVRSFVLKELQGIKEDLSRVKQNINKPDSLKNLYFSARKHYKHCEFFIEYCSPREAKYFINGPLVPKHDPDVSSQVMNPNGFQKIEELLFSDDKIDSISLSEESDLLKEKIEELILYYKEINIEDGQLLEMFQFELVRIAAMNLSGYDATIAQNNVTEALWSLQGVQEALNAFEFFTLKDPLAKTAFLKVRKSINKAHIFLQSNTDYNSFDRLKFITGHVNDINRDLITFHNACKLPWDKRKQALNLQQEFLFGKDAFNKQYFSIYYEDSLNLEKQVALGEKLFYEPMLSGNNINSCADCHKPEMAFAGGKLKSIVNNTSVPARNTPTLLNVIYQKAFFHDGRAYQLEQQVFDVIHNQNEMNSTLDDVVLKLRQNLNYKALFKKAFSETADTSITPYAVQKAITEYEKTLVSFNSRFDKYLAGDSKSLSRQEINGYNLFAGKALCGSCHFFPLFNGTVPPFYNDSEYEVLGVPQYSDNKSLDPDLGRFNVTTINEHKYAFKTPSLRNIELTSPYMHNGAYSTLEEVVDFYHKGGGAGLGFSVPNQTLPFDSLKLSPQETKEIVLFMKSLTDQDYVRSGKGKSKARQ